MKNIVKVIAASVVVLAASATASFAQATATASASANIVTPITIAKTVDLNFGNVAVSATTAGTTVLTPGGSRTATGGVTLPANAGTVAAASFTVSGQATYTYAITLPGTISISSGSNTMNVGSFTSLPATTGTLSGTGSQTLTVGATLNVSSNQAPGAYTNATGVAVTVNYN